MKKVNIKGVIVPDDVKWVYDYFEVTATSPSDVLGAIEDANSDNIEVTINSGGGDVFSGSEMYTALKDYDSNVTVKIVGIAASAASVIAMSGDEVQISPTAQIMIHNVSSGAQGDYRDLQHEANVLENYNKTIANAYRIKTGMPEEDLLDMMNEETWLNASDAKVYGFADKIMFEDDEMKLTASLNNKSSATLLPQAVIDKMRNEKLNTFADHKDQEDDDIINGFDQLKAQAKLAFLRLKITE